VKDPVCQTYVVMSRAIRSEVGGATVHFCSRECRDKYARGERRA
jgi:YHS domain-containing protein